MTLVVEKRRLRTRAIGETIFRRNKYATYITI
jgi:hypothetical protein